MHLLSPFAEPWKHWWTDSVSPLHQTTFPRLLGCIDIEVFHPRVLDGARACPPEDCGGTYGYADLVEILAKPRHKEPRGMREWAGKNFDPEKFSWKATNLLTKQSLPKSPKPKTVQIQ